MLPYEYEIRAHWFLSFIVLLIAFLFKLPYSLTIFNTLAYITNTHIEMPLFSSWLLIKILSELVKVKLMQLLELLFELIESLSTPSTSTSVLIRFLFPLLLLSFLYMLSYHLLYSLFDLSILRALYNLPFYSLLLFFNLLQYRFILLLFLTLFLFFIFLFLIISSFLLFDVLNQPLLLLPRE
jgi:hypothetical protein